MKFAWLIIIVMSALYVAISWIQYANLRNGIDLGTYTQILYNISSFHTFPPFNSILGQIAWGDHAHFIMIFLAPLFALYPHDLTPIILQIIAITTSAWALCDIAYKRFKNILYAYAILLSYVLFFGIQYALSFDVHANVFTCAILAWLFWAYETDKKKLYWIFFALTLLTREDAALFTSAFGFYVAIANRIPLLTKEGLGEVSRPATLRNPSPPPSHGTGEGKRRTTLLGTLTLIISIIYFFTTTLYVMPILQENHTALAYFDIDKRIFFHPVKLWQNMFDDSVKIRTFKNTFKSFSYLPLFSPFSYLETAPNFIARFLSGEQQRWTMQLHYSASLASVLAYGSILGTAMIVRIINIIAFLVRKFPSPVLGEGALPADRQAGEGNTSATAPHPLPLLIKERGNDKIATSRQGGTRNDTAHLIITSILAILLLYSTYAVSLRDVDLPIHQYFTRINTDINPDALSMRSRLDQLQQQIPSSDSIATISSFIPLFATREKINYINTITNFSQDWIIISNQFTSWPLSRKEINTAIHNLKQNPNYMMLDDTNNLFVFKKN